MAFFGLSDVRFEYEDTREFGPLSALEAVGGNFKQNSLKYPLDVGSADKGHYMIFFVREQKETQFSASYRGGQVFDSNSEKAIQEQLSRGISVSNRISKSQVKNSFADKINRSLENGIAKVNTAIYEKFGSTGKKVSGGISSFFQQRSVSIGEQKINDNITSSIKRITDKTPFGFINKTQLTSEAIALYMPDTIQFDSRQSYDGLSPGKELLGQALVALPGLVDTYRNAPSGAGGRAAVELLTLCWN